MIRENQLDGARKVQGEHAKVWRIPAAAFEARGFKPQAPTPAGPDATVTIELAELRHTLQSLTGALRIERQRLANKQQELEDAMMQVEQLRQELNYERTRRKDAEAQVAYLRNGLASLLAAEESTGSETTPMAVDLRGIDRFALDAERRRLEGHDN